MTAIVVLSLLILITYGLRPGEDLVSIRLVGLHKFMNYEGPMLTDCGGFQVFSLAKHKEKNISRGGS